MKASEKYWNKNLTYLKYLLFIWFIVSFGAGIIFKDLLNLLNLGLLILFISIFDVSPVAKIETISFVLVSPSQEIALNVFEIFFFNNFLRTIEEIDASVSKNPNVVAILGNVCPEPFAMP